MLNDKSFLLSDVPRVKVGNLNLTNVSTKQLIELAVRAKPRLEDRPLTVFAGHVSAINAEADAHFVNAFNEANLSYADGFALVVAGRLWRSDAQRVATTDLAPALLWAMHNDRLDLLKVAVVGSHEGIAADAARQLKNELPVDIVFTADGYPEDWATLFRVIRAYQPDVLILGLGMPLEALILQQYSDDLPACVIITCGGWLRILAGKEKRAPAVMQRMRLEWLWRLSTNPRRTMKRYVLGAWNVTRIAFTK